MISNVFTPRRIQTLQWYARRPRLWKQFFRTLREHTGHAEDAAARSAEQLREEASRWCESVAVSIEEALRQSVARAEVLSLDDECQREVAEGRVRQQQCPVKMGSGASVDLVYSLTEHSSAVHVVETGVAFGWSSFAVLHSVAKRNGHLISTDMPYPLRDNDAYVGCVVPERLHRHWTLLRAPDRDALPVALRRSGALDLCHYDSDKSEAGRRWAYPKLWDALRPGGIFVTDDAQDNLVFAEFAETVGRKPLVARIPERDHFKYSGIMVK